MTSTKSGFQHRLQQQPQRFVDRQQQQSSGALEFQPRTARNAERSDRPSPGQLGDGANRDNRERHPQAQSASIHQLRETRQREMG